jgi:hypothetical protein
MATISTETMTKVNAIFESIAGRPMTSDESNEIRAIATRINDADEFFLSSIAIQRAGRIGTDKLVDIVSASSKNIEERLRIFVTSDMQKTLDSLKESLEGLGHIADQQISYSAQEITRVAKNAVVVSVTGEILDKIHKEIDLQQRRSSFLFLGLSIAVSLLIGLGAGYFGFRF